MDQANILASIVGREMEADRKERDRATYTRSLLGALVCQMCGCEPNTGGTIVWYDENDERHEELCPYCNGGTK